MDRRIVINADDFGLCDAVNDAVVKAHTEGILTSATIMTNMPAADKAVEIAKELPTLGVGIHLNLTSGHPLCREPHMSILLDSDGTFACSPAKLRFLYLVIPKARAAVRAEISAQIRWAVDRGLKPTHLDSHQHVHTFPPIFSLVCQFAKQFDIPAIRFALEPKQVSYMPWPLPGDRGRERARSIRRMAKINRLQNKDFLKTDALFGVAHTGKIDHSFFKAVTLYGQVQTAEVMTHPGFAEGLNGSQTTMIQQRQAELDLLCSDKTKRLFEDAAITLVHYGQL